MTKVLAKVLAGVCIAVVCCGNVCGDSQKATAQTKLVQKTYVETFHSGDTVDDILSVYHNEKNEGVDFREFKYNTLHLKENAHLLNKHGGLKLVQVGEKITIVVKQQEKI